MTGLQDIGPSTMSNHNANILPVPGSTGIIPSASAPDLADPLTDSDDEALEVLTQEQKAADRRRTQNAKFESWMSSRAEQLGTDDVQQNGKPLDDDAQTTAYLVGRQESNVIITGPREYQTELFERAKEQNTIAVLPTGAGKTLIAVLLLKHILDQELEDRALGKRHRIAFFLVDCVTLVFQQHAVLECNLDQKIDRFCGDMGCDLWSKAVWEQHFADNMAIVCTAEVLHQCLMHAFISIDQINILIFDEAHHTKKNHAYARIIKDFYVTEEDGEKRPRIFGMTASPIDAKVDVVKAARELETLLHCQIATTADLALLQESVHQPEEQIGAYEPLLEPFETPLYKRMNKRLGDIEILDKPFTSALEASSQLGAWCADQIWSFTFADDDNRKLESKLERDFWAKKPQIEPPKVLDANLALLREARQLIRLHPFRQPRADLADLSSKVLLLQKYIRQVFERPTESKVIVFVQKRYTARLLAHLFSHANMRTPHLRVDTLVGTRKGDIGDLNVSYRQQVITLTRFRKGFVNCLFATSIAEEGLDIADCNVVIRFDLYDTLIQYIQSRGRARHLNSKYVHMIEKGNLEHVETVRAVRSGEEEMNRFCAALPADRILQGNDCDIDEALARERHHRVYIEQETGAKLTYGSSLAVLAHFVGSLPCDAEGVSQAEYIMSCREKQFVCEVILPENSPIRSAIGRLAPRKAVAKRSAAFEACLLLRKGKFLDKHLLPIFQKQLPAMRNALLALTVKKAREYDMRPKPAVWAESVGQLPSELLVTVLQLSEPVGLGRPYQPLALLTRKPLPLFPAFPLFFRSGASSQVVCTPLTASLPVTDARLEKINHFTLRIFKDLFNKSYESDAAQMPYWLVPIISEPGLISVRASPEHVVDWAALETVCANEQLGWNADTPDEFFLGRFLVDPMDGGIRYFSVKIASHLKPTDPVPAGVPHRRQRSTILDYSSSFWKNTRHKVQWRLEQPVLEVELIQHRRTWLDEITENEKGGVTKCFVCPEPLRVSALSPAIAAMGYLFPAIIFRLDSYLVALELCQSLQLEIQPQHALEAVTKDSDNTEEHRSLQMHFQRGMGRNYERLEFMGDCFLKMATSISLYTQHPDDDEFQYHVSRMLLICNKNLLKTAVERKFYEYIRSKSFQRRSWYPEGPKLLQGKVVGKGMQKHMLGDKTIADVCEAIIGAAVVSHAETGKFDDAVRAVTEMVQSPDHSMTRWDEYYALYKKPQYQTAEPTRSQIDLVEQIEKEDRYRFRYPRLLRSAFLHPSYPPSWEKIPCYQRLEFLGDSLLDMACVNFLFHRFPDRDPQWLTEHKMAMVSNRFLGALCVKLGFHKHLRSNSPTIGFQIRMYITELEEAERLGEGSPDYWVSAKQAPKALPDIVEAYVGALFVDSSFSYPQVERFFQAHIQPFFEDISIYDTFANSHPTTHLTSLLTTSLGCSAFRVQCSPLPPPATAPLSTSSTSASQQFLAAVMVHEDIIAEGRATSVRYARVRASEEGVRVLSGLSPAEFRMKYACDCKDLPVDMEWKKGRDGEMAEEEVVRLGRESASAISGECVVLP